MKSITFLIALILNSFSNLAAQEIEFNLNWTATENLENKISSLATSEYKLLIDTSKNVCFCGMSIYIPPSFYQHQISRYDTAGNHISTANVFEPFGNHFIKDCALDKNNNLITAGRVINPSPSGAFLTYVITKFDEDGTEIWSIDGIGPISQILIDEDNNIYIIGAFFENTSQVAGDIVLKLNENGETIWSNTISSSIPFGGSSGQLTPEGIKIIGFGDDKHVIHQVDASGNTIQTTFIEDNNNEGNVHIDKEGNIYFGDDFSDYRLDKVSFDGDTVWTYQLSALINPPVAPDRLLHIETDEELNVYISGQHYDGLDSSSNIVTTKLNALGEVIWQNRYRAIRSFADNLYVSDKYVGIVGKVRSDTTENFDKLLLIYDRETGEQLVTHHYDHEGNLSESTTTIFIEEDDIYLAGQSSPSNDLYDVAQNVIQKYSINVMTNTVNINPNQNWLKIFPIPFNEKLIFNFNLKQSGNVAVTITNVEGENFFHQSQYFSKGEHSFQIPDSNSLPNGMLIVMIETNNEIITEKIIKH